MNTMYFSGGDFLFSNVDLFIMSIFFVLFNKN